jgi:hypothetical protein
VFQLVERFAFGRAAFFALWLGRWIDAELNFSKKTIHVGIDTHLKNWKIAIALEHSIQKIILINLNNKYL